jgi:hypothetical protein
MSENALAIEIARLAEDNNVSMFLTGMAPDLRHNLTVAGIEIGKNQVISTRLIIAEIRIRQKRFGQVRFKRDNPPGRRPNLATRY